MSKRSLVLNFVIALAFVSWGHRTFGQSPAAPGAAATTAYSELPVSPKYKPIAPEIVASNEAAATADAQRSRDRTLAYNNARKVLGNQIPADDAGKKLLDEWYVAYFLPSFTSPENRGQLSELRSTLLDKDLRPAKQAAAITHLRAAVLKYMTAFAQSPGTYNFHPAVRYNAMLVIGDLNLVEYNARYPDNSKALVPEPLPEALDLLLAEYKSPKQIDAVRVAALVGIDRHVKLDVGRPVQPRIGGTKKKAIVDEMIALLNATPPAGRSAEGHTWMQRRAIDILAALGMVGAYPEANAALEKIVADKDAPISLRCTASEALAHWTPNNNKIDASAVSRNLGLIAVKACKDELDRIAALERQEIEMKQLRELIKKASPVASYDTQGGGASGMGGMGEGMYGNYGDGGETSSMNQDDMYGGGDMDGMYGGMGGGMYGGALGAKIEIPTDPRIIWSRRRLKYQLTCVKRGLAGMAVAGKATPHEKVIGQVATAVDAALVLTDPPEDKPDLEGLSESIRKGVRGLAFLSPEAAEIGIEPVADSLPSAAPATAPASAVSVPAPDAPAAEPAVDPAAPVDGGLPTELPPGL